MLACAEEDRRARRRKLGLPEELSEEEKAAEAAKAAEKERAKVAAAFVPVKPVTQISKLRKLLVRPLRLVLVRPLRLVLQSSFSFKWGGGGGGVGKGSTRRCQRGRVLPAGR